MKPELITPEEYARYRRTTVQSLADERYHGTGPKFIKYGRAVRYRWSDIEKFEHANTFVRADNSP
ncbi:DNA-binding protein [Nocardia sp. NPDC051052]|uniref:DNA-binding protein n=1 Tax=Nocardia sp. NPDC051052 TaxID=3364322 RepID=UPI003788BE91